MEKKELPKCIFCGGKTRLSNKKVGQDWEIRPCWDNHWSGKVIDRRRHYLICNKCVSRGPMKPTPEEAIDAYRVASN